MERFEHVPHLSPRELQLIQYAAHGYTDTAIALKLGISEATVGTYWGRVRIKMGPYNRTELVSLYLQSQQEEEMKQLREQNEKLQTDLAVVVTEAEQRSLYFDVIEHAPDAILLISGDGVIREANAMAREMFGYGTVQMIGIPARRLLPVRLTDAHQEDREGPIFDAELLAVGLHVDVPVRRADGTEFSVQASLSSMATESGSLITCILRESPTAASEIPPSERSLSIPGIDLR